MKFSGLLSALALATAARAGAEPEPQFPGGFGFSIPSKGGPPAGYPTGPPSGPFGSPSSTVSSSASSSIVFGKPSARPSVTSVKSNPYANPGIPADATKTAAASQYGGFKSITPPVPGKIPQPFNMSSWANSQDAKANPNLRNTPTHRGQWLPGYDINTDTETSWPNTGKTVKYTLTIQNSTITVAGVSKQMLNINGQFPGPKIEANWGDMLEITVINKMANNGTSIHWHGLRQFGTNTQDGVNGVTECPLAPGDTKVYKFQATSHGTSWYHSHFSVQYGDGVLGPLVIYGPASANYDIDLGPIVVQETYPQSAFQEDWYAHRHGPPTASNYLLNGQNVALDGSVGSRAKFQFTAGKKHRIRLINTSMDALFKIQIDGHNMTVIESDFVPITPYVTSELSMSIGQRYDIIVEANQAPGNYWLRAMAAKDCTFSANPGTGSIANGIVSYSNAPSPDALPNSTYSTHSDACVDESVANLVPVVNKTVDSSTFAAIASSLPVNIAVVQATDGIVFQWTIGGITQNVDWNNPVIAQAVTGNNTYPVEEHVVTLNTPDVWTFWVIQNQFFVPHPMHLHGHDFSLLGQGTGTFDASADFSKLNFVNPPRRDVALLMASGWTVIAFKTDNPGSWLMHCHIAWHAGEGLALQFLERPADIPGKYLADVQSSAFQNTCANWNTYSKTMYYPKIDSGLRKRTLENGLEVMELESIPSRRRAVGDYSAPHVRKHAHSRRAFPHY